MKKRDAVGKHTPGPKFELNGVRFCDDMHNTELFHSNDFPVYGAAPELLKAVKELVQICINEGNWETKQAAPYLNLIRKAQGE